MNRTIGANLLRRFMLALTSLGVLLLVLVPAASAVMPVSQFAAVCKAPAQRILNFPAWYSKLDCDAQGHPEINELNDVWLIALNLIEWLIIAAAYVAAGFIIWAGFKYMRSKGDPGKLQEAKTAILQAVVGLAITLTSVAIVEFVTGVIQT